MDILKSRSEARRTEVSVLLDTEQIFKLDEIAAVIRHDTGKQLTRSAIIRAILSSSLPYKQNWLKCRSEEHLRQTVSSQLARGKG